jgi:hypothetical protein
MESSMFFPFFVSMFSSYVASVHVTVFHAVELAAFAAPMVMTFKTMMKPGINYPMPKPA